MILIIINNNKKVADIGIGIAGLEGREAVLAADFSFVQFRFLSRLLLVHGYQAHTRIATSVLTFYTKATMFVLPVIFFQFICQFTSQMLYHVTYQVILFKIILFYFNII